jgi:integrase
LGNRECKYKGVEQISNSSVRINFTYLGRGWREIEPIKTGDDDVVHRSCKKWEDIRALIVADIKAGRFDYAAYFPKSKKLEQVQALLGNKQNIFTTKDYLYKWLKASSKSNEETTSLENFQIIKNRMPNILSIPIDKLTFEDVETMAEGWGNRTHTIDNKISPIRCALRLAVHDGLIPSNWLAHRKIEGVEVFDPDHDDDINPFNKQERTDLLKACKHQQDRNLFRFLIWTGLRPSEVCCLKWSDIDWTKGTIRVNKSFPRKATRLKPPKTKSGKRLVKILPDCKFALNSQKQFTYIDGNEIIFHNPNTNEPWNADNKIRDHWVQICKIAGVTYRRPYQLRHTYATMMIMAGEPIRWISTQMGHSSVMHTLDIYSRWIDDDDPTSGDKASKIYSDIDDEEIEEPKPVK